jgi:hypothetical protein
MNKYFHYTACGLDNVWLANGYKVKATRHGEAVAVNDVDGLHQLIANTLIDKREGNTKLADAMARTKTSHKFNFSKYLLNEVNGKWTLSVVNDQAALQRESARRLAALGGSDPDIQAIPRRQSQVA